MLLICATTYGCNDGDIPDDPPVASAPSVFDWTLQRSGVFVDLHDLYFINNNAGWAVGGNNTILSTSSGGEQWPEAPVSSFEGTFRSVHLIDDQRGWIAGDLAGAIPDGSVYISINGGAYPEPQKKTDFPMNAVFMLNEEYGWAVGDKGQILYTQDGMKWEQTTTKFSSNILDVEFTDKLNGWIVGSNGTISRSDDGGITWIMEYSKPGFDIVSVQIIDATAVWACGEGNTILKRDSDNESATWIGMSIESEFSDIRWNDIFFIDRDLGWIVGESGTIYNTQDGGARWAKESSESQSDLNAIHMLSDRTGWIAGTEGTILTYTP